MEWLGQDARRDRLIRLVSPTLKNWKLNERLLINQIYV